MPPAAEKMWNTQYMDDFNKKKVGRMKNAPTETWRYNRPHPKKTFLEPKRPKTASTNSWFIKKAQKTMNESYQVAATENDVRMYSPAYNPTPMDLTVRGERILIGDREIPKQYLLQLYNEAMAKRHEEDRSREHEESKKDDNTSDEKEEKPTEEDRGESVNRSKTPIAEYHWSCWPEPEPPNKDPPTRPHTVLGIHRAPTPYGARGDDIEDRPDSPEPSYVFGVHEESARGPPMTFVPELQSWINASSEYDKDAAYKVMSFAGSLAPPLPQEALRPQRQATFSFGGARPRNMYRTVPDPRGFYAMSWMPLTEDFNASEERRIKEMDRRMGVSDSLPQIPLLQRSNTDIRPMQRRVIRYPKSEDYIHEHSMFMTTQPLCRGHFIIHPDWVSERMTKKRINLANRKLRNGLRYGASEEY